MSWLIVLDILRVEGITFGLFFHSGIKIIVTHFSEPANNFAICERQFRTNYMFIAVMTLVMFVVTESDILFQRR